MLTFPRVHASQPFSRRHGLSALRLDLEEEDTALPRGHRSPTQCPGWVTSVDVNLLFDFEHPESLTLIGRPRSAQANDAMHLCSGGIPVQVEIFRTEFGRRSWCTVLLFGYGESVDPIGEHLDQQLATDTYQLLSQCSEFDFVVQGNYSAGIDRPCVESLFHLHDAHTSLVISGQNRSLNRCGTAPAGKE